MKCTFISLALYEAQCQCWRVIEPVAVSIGRNLPLALLFLDCAKGASIVHACRWLFEVRGFCAVALLVIVG